MIQETRYKAVVIPRINGKYVAVRDFKNQEITFVTGGCKKYETSRQCALRELREETFGALGNLKTTDLIYRHTFYSRNRSKRELEKDRREGKVVTMEYNVFFVDVNIPWVRVEEQFKNGLKRARNIETDKIYLMSKEEYKSRRNLWSFMRENIIPLL